MRKIIVFNMVSLDGYFAGPDGDISWHNVDDEFNDFAMENQKEIGTIIFGRVTYEMMASYWPSPIAPQQNPKAIVDSMNSLPKIVFSKNMDKADWNNTVLMKDVNKEEIKQMQSPEGKDIFIFGSGQIVQTFANAGLIDEYRLMVNPIILGSGKPMFANIEHRINLKLTKTREFKNGNVLLYYKKS